MDEKHRRQYARRSMNDDRPLEAGLVTSSIAAEVCCMSFFIVKILTSVAVKHVYSAISKAQSILQLLRVH